MVPGLLIKALEQLVSIKWGLGDCRPGLGIITDVGEAGARLCLCLLALVGGGHALGHGAEGGHSCCSLGQ